MAFDASREGQLDEDRLKWGYWWVTHQVQVRKATAIALIILNVFLVGYPIYGFADWFLLSGVQERADSAMQTKQYTDYAGFRVRNAPQDLSVEAVSVMGASQEAFDLVTRITNPNTQWRVAFDYRFTTADGETSTQRAYVLPGDTRWLYALGVRGARPSGSSVRIENIRWSRVNLHEIRPDYAGWSTERLDIRVTDILYQLPLPQDPVAVSKAKFRVTNATAYGYYNLGLFVALYSGTRLTGVNRVALSEIRAGETREVEASWFTEIPAATRVEVTPEIDIFDTRAYIPAGR